MTSGAHAAFAIGANVAAKDHNRSTIVGVFFGKSVTENLPHTRINVVEPKFPDHKDKLKLTSGKTLLLLIRVYPR
jgi:hypothetical protein